MASIGSTLFAGQGLTKEYATRVLDQVDFEVCAGEIHGLLGANGAGKSTLCRIVSGLIASTEGSMQLQGIAYQPRDKQAAEAAGIQIVQQELNLIPTLDVAHNLFLTRLPHRFGWVSHRQLYREAERLLVEFGLRDLNPRSLVGSLGVGQRQMLEIASTLDRDCRLLILDEPTAALSPRETQRLFDHLRAARTRGVGIVYISHRLNEVMELTDRATILRDGRKVGTIATADLDQARIVRGMTHGYLDMPQSPTDSNDTQLATESDSTTEKLRAAADDKQFAAPERPVVLEVRDLGRGKVVQHVSFSVSQGEILGIGGLVGSGRTEMLRLLFGADIADTGEVDLEGQGPQKPFRSPDQAVRAGVVMVSEDRKADGLLLTQSIANNIVLSKLSLRPIRNKSSPLRSGWGRLLVEANRRVASDYVEQMSIRCNGVDQSAGTLSGGNQQKVVIAKWLLRGAKVYLFDEPTRGIDAHARDQIYNVMRELAREGKAILVVSSDLEELIQISDRIGIMSNGRWIGEFRSEAFDREKLVDAMFDGYRGRK